MYRERHPSPTEVLIASATHLAQFVDTPEELANHLAFLQIDLSDGDFRALALRSSSEVHAGYARLVEEAVAAGELVVADPAALARLVQAVTGGSLIAWAIHREGAVVDWVRRDLDALIAPYRAPTRTPAAAPRARGSRGRAPRTGHPPAAPRRSR